MSRNDTLLYNLEHASISLQLHIQFLQAARLQIFPFNFLSVILASAAHLQYELYLQQASNPCEDTQDTLQCYKDELSKYGVIIRGAGDLLGHTLVEFTEDQLKTILQGVQAVDSFLQEDVASYFENDINPGDAFKLVFGHIEFGYDPDQGFGLTVATADPNATPEENLNLPKCLSSPIYIFLASASFPPLGVLPDSFIVVHELGHAFHNRHGGKTGLNLIAPIASSEFVEATESIWFPFDGYISLSEFDVNIYGPQEEQIPRTNPDPNTNVEFPYLDKSGMTTTEISAYFISAGFYFALNYEGASTLFFPNETRHDPPPGPSEGFADTFANLILDTGIMPTDSPRYEYFEPNNMPSWIITILERDSNSFCVTED